MLGVKSFFLLLLLVNLMLEIYLEGNHLAASCSFNFLPEIEFSPSRISASQGTKLKKNQLYIDFIISTSLDNIVPKEIYTSEVSSK